MGVFEATILNFANRTSANITEEDRVEQIFQATYVFEEFLLAFARYHLNQTTPKLNISSRNVGK